jgi:hypothetical protein
VPHLEIEATAKRRLADEYDAAQERSRGRSCLPAGNRFRRRTDFRSVGSGEPLGELFFIGTILWRLAAEYFERFPKDRYQTAKSWRELQSQNISNSP